MQSNLTIPKYLKSPSISRDSSLIFNDNKTTTMHSRVQSALLTTSGLRASIMTSEFGFRSNPSSPKAPATMPMFSNKDDDQDVVSRAAKSTRLMRKISTFAKNPSVDFGVKAKTINAIEARKIQSYQSPRMLSPKSPLNILLQSHGNFLDHFVGKSPSNGVNSLMAIKDELDLVEKKYSPMVIEHHKFVYFQIACHNMPSPLVINIVKGTNGNSNARLKVFVSKFNKRPSALSCDYTVESRNIKIYERDYKDTFDATAYYFGIYSENKFEGKVMFFFGETLTAVKRERPQGISFNLKQNWKTRAQDVDPINVDDIKQIKKELRKKRWIAGGCVNRVERNKSIKSPDDKQKELVEKRVLLESRSSDVLENRNKRESMKLQRKMFLVERHDIQKAVKNDARMKFEERIAKMIFHRDWIQALVFPVLMKNLKKIYDEKREAFKRRQRIFLKIQLFAIRYRRKLQRKGPSLVDRLVFDIRGALELHVRSLTIVQKTEIQSVVCKLFAEYALYANTMKSILRTHTILKKFAERWLLAKKRKQVFMKVVGMIWDKYHMGILSELSPADIKKPESNRSIDSEDLSILDRKQIKEEKKKRFVEYMLKYSYYKFNKNIHRFRLNFEDLEPKLKKTADYAKYWLLDRKKFIKNSLITKVENCDINAIFSHDINLSDPVYQLYHKIDIIRPPKLFYIPKVRVVQKAVIALAKGDDEIKTMESLPEFIIYE